MAKALPVLLARTFAYHYSTAQPVIELKKKELGFLRRAPEKGTALTLERTSND